MCGRQTLLLASFPHAWDNARGEEVRGRREALLCPQCERGEPAADALMALFRVDGQVDMANVETFADLARAWVEAVRDRRVNITALAAQEEQYWRGEL